MKTLLRWLPATLLLAVFGLLWSTSASGGEEGVLAWILLMSVLPYLGALVLLAVIGLFIWKRNLTTPLFVTFLVSLFTIWPYLWQVGVLPMAYPVSIETTSPSATVRLPSDDPLLVGWGGDTPKVNYHVTFPNQRWAYDLMVEPALNGSNQLEDYGCWGVEILSPAKGEIVIAHDGEPDHIPGQDSEGYANPAGNHIFIQLENTGTFLAIAHFQEGSLVVREGEDVREGQLLGRCGNSGSTSEPHIHIHHQRQDPRITPLDLAEGLPLFFRDHDGEPMPEGGIGSSSTIVQYKEK